LHRTAPINPLFFRDKENGLLASDSNQFAEGIELLLSNPTLRKKIVFQGRQDYLRKLSTEAAALNMDSILRRFVHVPLRKGADFAK